jgi:ectonucleotide pyrophosphatase/phosphodiesterase family member 5
MQTKKFFYLFLTIIVSACSTSTSPPMNTSKDPKPLTLLISIDGFKPEYLQPESAPKLYQLAQQGASSKGMLSVFPSYTFPNHYSIVTGLYPDHHGIVNNSMRDPHIPEPFRLSSKSAVANSAWWEEGTPIWVSAQKKGLITSTLFWPGSEAKIKGIQPNDWLVYNKNIEDVDSMGHRFGPKSNDVKRAISEIDHAIENLIQGLDRLHLLSMTTIIIVSDHGMAEVTANQRIQLKNLLSSFDKPSIEWQGPLAGINLNGEIPLLVLNALNQNKNIQCWQKSNIPSKYHFGTHRRIPDIVCLADLGFSMVDGNLSYMIPGQHGFDPELKDMHGIFIASGYRVKPSKLDLFENIEIYPLLCHLLNIPAEKNDAKDILFRQMIRN